MYPSQTLIHSLVRGLTQLDHMLEKAEQWTTQNQADTLTLSNSRLIEDMFPLSKQIQITCDNAKALAARLSGNEIPKFIDDETTLPELRARIAKTLEFVHTCTGTESMDTIEATFPWNPGKKLLGESYIYTFGLPNFYFHLTTAYNILRAHGVQVGKNDFL